MRLKPFDRLVVIATLLVLLSLVLFPPWITIVHRDGAVLGKRLGHHFVLVPPESNGVQPQVDYDRIGLLGVGTILLAAILVFMERQFSRPAWIGRMRERFRRAGRTPGLSIQANDLKPEEKPAVSTPGNTIAETPPNRQRQRLDRRWGMRLLLIVGYWAGLWLVGAATLELRSPAILTVFLLVALLVAASQVILPRTRHWFETKHSQLGFWFLVFIFTMSAGAANFVSVSKQIEGYATSTGFQSQRNDALSRAELTPDEMSDESAVLRVLIKSIPELYTYAQMQWSYRLMRDTSEWMALVTAVAYIIARSQAKRLSDDIRNKIAQSRATQ